MNILKVATSTMIDLFKKHLTGYTEEELWVLKWTFSVQTLGILRSAAIEEASHINPDYPDFTGYNWTVNLFKPDSNQQVLSVKIFFYIASFIFHLFRDLSKTALSFSIVRHPFERIVSAYENKMLQETWLTRWFRKNYGEPTFEKYAGMIIEKSQRCGANFCVSMNAHWRPFLEACSYCDLDYSFITKVGSCVH